MRYLPDTNIVVALTRHGDARVAQRFARFERQIALSTIVLFELAYGAYCSDRPRVHLDTLDELAIPRLEWAEQDARAAGEVRAALKRAATPIGPYDVMIAGQALARDLILVTHNVTEFLRVDGLRVEDWLA